MPSLPPSPASADRYEVLCYVSCILPWYAALRIFCVTAHIIPVCMRLLYPTKTPQPRKQRGGKACNWVAYTTIRSGILLARISRWDDKQLNRSYVHGARKCVWGNCRSKHLISSLHLEFLSSSISTRPQPLIFQYCRTAPHRLKRKCGEH